MNIQNQKGITLTELLISVAILGILISIAGTFLLGGIRFFRLSTAKGEIQRDARTCIDLINRNLRQAKASTVTINRFNNAMPPCSAILFADANSIYHYFYQNNDQFWVAKSTGGAWSFNKVADNLRSLSFAFPHTDDGTLVSVSICFEKATYEDAAKSLQLSVEKVRIMNE